MQTETYMLLGAGAVAAGTMMTLGLLSGYIKNRFSISEPIIALAVGITLGPLGLGWLTTGTLGLDAMLLLEYGALVTLSLSVMGAALRLPKAYLQRHWREMAVILIAGMTAMSVTSGLVAWLMLPVSLLSAALIGAIVAPTDPVLADSIVTGDVAERYLPHRLRDSISAESGANDGLAAILVMLPLMLMEHPPGSAAGHWLVDVVLREAVGGVLLGIAIGLPCGLLLRRLRGQAKAERMSLLSVGVALALTVLALSELLHVSGILATFTAGVIFNDYLDDDTEVRHEHIQEAIGRFFDLPIIILFGALLPWQDWLGLDSAVLFAALAILLLRRLPAWWLLRPRLPSLRSSRDALFNGWFGPIGIAALYYALVAHEQHDTEIIWPVVSLVVFCSIVVHGVSATPFTRRYPRGELGHETGD